VAVSSATVPAHAASGRKPRLIRDVKTGRDRLPSFTMPVSPAVRSGDPEAGYIQGDTEVEPSIAVNHGNPRNAVAVYQEGRMSDGGAESTGFAATFDAGAHWTTGEIPGLTLNPGPGPFERSSDPVAAWGVGNTVYSSSIVFDSATNGGIHSGIAISLSRDGGRHWKKPVFVENDDLGIEQGSPLEMVNDKEWIVVDTSNAPGHHLGRVYVIWDRIDPILYDYCDHDCDKLANWLPNMQTVPGIVSPTQGVGAIPMVLKSGALGFVINTVLGGVPQIPPDLATFGSQLDFFVAPLAGSTPYPLPLTFVGPIEVAADASAGVAAQRASGGFPSADVDPRTGTVYVVWDDSRFRSDGTNDAVISRSSDEGMTWTPPAPVNPGPRDDKIDHYGVVVAVGRGGRVHVAWRQRDETGRPPMLAPVVDTYYEESADGGRRFTRPLRINRVPSNPFYAAYSEGGSFEGDYNQAASAGELTYVVRCQAGPNYAGEPPALVPDSANPGALKLGRRGHQHQSAWVAVLTG